MDDAILVGQPQEQLCLGKAYRLVPPPSPCLGGLTHGQVVKWRKILETEAGQTVKRNIDEFANFWFTLKTMAQRRIVQI